MLKITIQGGESFDEATGEFVYTEDVTLSFEHSLVSLSKWESKWEIPFLSDDERTDEHTLDYIRFMCLTPDVSPEVFQRLSRQNIQTINDYIGAKMTATWFAEKKARPGPREVITAELFYYWMISLNIPFECQYWHLQRLLTLIKVCDQKNQPEKKTSRSELVAQRRAMNEQRKAQLKTSG